MILGVVRRLPVLTIHVRVSRFFQLEWLSGLHCWGVFGGVWWWLCVGSLRFLELMRWIHTTVVYFVRESCVAIFVFITKVSAG